MKSKCCLWASVGSIMVFMGFCEVDNAVLSAI